MGKVKKVFISNNPEVLTSLGAKAGNEGRSDEALALFLKVKKINPQYPRLYYNLGLAYKSLGKIAEAIKAYKKAVKLEPENSLIYTNLGIVYYDLGQYNEAIRLFKKAIKKDPNNAKAFNNLANTLVVLGHYRQAIPYYEQSLAIDPTNEVALVNTGVCLRERKHLEAAMKCFSAAVKANPEYPNGVAYLVNAALNLLEWDIAKKYTPQLEKLNERCLKTGARLGEAAFFNIIRLDDPKKNLEIARAHSLVKEESVAYLKDKLNFTFTPRVKRKKIRIGYASNGFRDFPTGHNIAGVFENHDKSRFEVFAFSFGSDDKSPWRKRIEAASNFIDIANLSFQEGAKLIYKKKIDILIDLKGQTTGGRGEMFALRPAPIQVNLLGFAGSTGSNYIDYFIGDKVVIPPHYRKYFSEKIVFMPDTYWPTDNKLTFKGKVYSRRNFGLKEGSIVYASFNNTYKIEEEVFKTWMRILKQVKNSVLWIYDETGFLTPKMKMLGKKGGINPERIITTGRLPKIKHLQRFQLADIALDTKTVNGHTTTTDALWAGVPVITTPGRHLMARVSASVLTALNMPKLITPNLKEYEKLAVGLGKNPEKLAVIKSKLQKNLKTEALFDTSRYTRSLEKACLKMWENYQKGKVPSDIHV